MNDSQKIEELLHYFRMDQKEFAEKCGFNPRIISNVKRCVCGISKNISQKIITAFPEVNRFWLLEDEEPMIINNQNIGNISNSSVNLGRDGNTVKNTDVSESIVRNYQKTIEKQQEQIDKLIDVIGKLTQK